MTPLFLILAAVLTAGALLFILPTLLRKKAVANPHALRDEVNLAVLRDQLSELDADLAAGTIDAPGYESARHELERRVAEDVQPAVSTPRPSLDKRWTAAAVGLAVPVLVVTLYLLVGTPAGLDPAQVNPPNAQAPQVTEEQIVNMVAKLAQRLKDKPDDVQGWHMLARSYNALGRFGDAAEAYAHVVKLAPGDADLLADYADALAMSLNKRLQGEPEKLIVRALAIDPKNLKALALSGSAAFERHDYKTAVAQWNKVLAQVPPESEMARAVASSISEAQGLAGEPAKAQAPLAAASTATAAAASTATAAEVAGTVTLDAALRTKVADSDTVFIFARAVEGPRFPLAVQRKQVKDLPANFVLDDSMSMVPNAKLSGFPMVVVGARISKSGSATPSAGDFEGISQPVQPGAKGLKIVINSERK